MSISELYSDESYCLQEIVRIREAWGNVNTFTERMIDSSRMVLGFMQLYGPGEIQVMVDATLDELERREVLGLFRRCSCR